MILTMRAQPWLAAAWIAATALILTTSRPAQADADLAGSMVSQSYNVGCSDAPDCRVWRDNGCQQEQPDGILSSIVDVSPHAGGGGILTWTTDVAPIGSETAVEFFAGCGAAMQQIQLFGTPGALVEIPMGATWMVLTVRGPVVFAGTWTALTDWELTLV